MSDLATCNTDLQATTDELSHTQAELADTQNALANEVAAREAVEGRLAQTQEVHTTVYSALIMI